jgi:hypothetical protein
MLAEHLKWVFYLGGGQQCTRVGRVRRCRVKEREYHDMTSLSVKKGAREGIASGILALVLLMLLLLGLSLEGSHGEEMTSLLRCKEKVTSCETKIFASRAE